MMSLKVKYPDKMWDISKIAVGEIVRDWLEEGVRVIIMRGPASLNVYMGIPPNHPLAGHSYDDLPIDCHGGLTFAGHGEEKKYWPAGYFWYGYDYAHAGDQMYFERIEIRGDKKWTIGEIVKEAWTPAYEIKKLMKLTEAVVNKVKGGE